MFLCFMFFSTPQYHFLSLSFSLNICVIFTAIFLNDKHFFGNVLYLENTEGFFPVIFAFIEMPDRRIEKYIFLIG
jgi:hypothetical protein